MFRYALALSLLLACAPAVAADVELSPIEAALVEQCNAFRARSGLPALKPAAWLMQRARSHCRWMLSHGMIHSGGIAENIAMGQPSVSSVTSTWINSPGHNVNMRGAHVYIGVAGYKTASGTPYWVQQFSAAKDGSPVAIEGGPISTVGRKAVSAGRRLFGRFRR